MEKQENKSEKREKKNQISILKFKVDMEHNSARIHTEY